MSPAPISSFVVGLSRGHAGQGRRPVTAYVLRSNQLAVEVWDHGARLVRVEAPDRHGRFDNVVLRHQHLSDYDDPTGPHAYLGATIGRTANRIGNSRLVLDGAAHILTANEGVHHLDGGSVGFDQYVWERVDRSDRPGEEDKHANVTFRHVSPDGDQGYPGELTMQVSYSVSGNLLHIETIATTTAPTVVGTTNHAYWNLAGAGTIGGHWLRVAADRYVPVDADAIPTGQLEPVSGLGLDFRRATALGDAVSAGGVDHCLVFGPASEQYPVELYDPQSGRRLAIATNQAGVQVYTGQYLPTPFSALCLEPQALPDTPNHGTFGSCELRPGATYSHSATYRFGVEGDAE